MQFRKSAAKPGILLVLLVVFSVLSSRPSHAQSQCGINIDPTNPAGHPTTDSVAGSDWVRIEFKSCTIGNDVAGTLGQSLADYGNVIDTYNGAGINVLLIIDYLSYPDAMNNPADFAVRAGLIANAYIGKQVAYQIWNEPDIWLGGNMSPSQFAAIMGPAAAAIKAADPSAIVVSGSMASGQASWIAGLAAEMPNWSSDVDGVAFHPYGKVPDLMGGACNIPDEGGFGKLSEFIAALEGVTNKPLWITEIGLNTVESDLQATYLTCFYNQISTYHPSVSHVLWFGWSDGMVYPMGIVTASADPKLAHSSYFSDGCGVSVPGSVSNSPAIPFIIDPGTGCSVSDGGGWPPGDEESCPFPDTPISISGQVRTTFPTLDKDGRVMSGQPVRGAAVGVYEGTWDNDSGNRKGMVSRYAYVTTDGRGDFTIVGRRKGCGNSFDNSMYMMFWCGDNYVDAYKIALDEEEIEWDVVVPCEQREYIDPPTPPDSFNLSTMGVPLSCGFVADKVPVQKANVLGTHEIAPGFLKKIRLIQRDFATQYNGKQIAEDGSTLPPGEKISPPDDTEFPGRNDISQVLSSYSYVTRMAGYYGTGAQTPIEEGETFEDKLIDCERIRKSNRLLPSEGAPDPNVNINTAYQQAIRLSEPALGGNSMWKQLYARALSYNPAVCEISGEIIKLDQIEPPEDIYDGGDSYDLPSDYFPLLSLLGDPLIGAYGESFDDNTVDSFTPNIEFMDTSRDDILDDDGDEEDMMSWDRTDMQTGTPDFSWDVKYNLVDSEYAGDFGASNPLAAVLAVPFEPFGYNTELGLNEALDYNNSDVFNKVGRGDYQIGRPLQLCSAEIYDVGYDHRLDMDECLYDDHAWCSGFKYIGPTGGILSDIIAFFKSFFGGETIMESVYDKANIGPDILYESFSPPTQEDVSGEPPKVNESALTGSCVSWRSIAGSCDTDENTCRIADCLIYDPVTGLPEDPIKKCVSKNGCETGEPNAVCIYQRPWYVCNGDLIALFEGRDISFNYAPFDKADAYGMLQFSSVFREPYKPQRIPGLLTLTNYEITDQESPDEATRAFNDGRTGSGTESKYGYLLNSVSDPAFGTNEPAPPFGPGVAPGGDPGVAPPEDPGDPYEDPGAIMKCGLPSSDENLCTPQKILEREPRFTATGSILAAGICNQESGGDATAKNNSCDTLDPIDPGSGNSYDYSVGLFQINLAPYFTRNDDGDIIALLQNSHCPEGTFSLDLNEEQANPPKCLVLDRDLLNDCVAKYLDPVKNTIEAWEMSSGGSNWCPWAASLEAYCDICNN